jgi:hypothetical protein
MACEYASRVPRNWLIWILEVEYANRTPKSGIPAITVNCLLVGFVCFVVLLANHVGTNQAGTSFERLKGVCMVVLITKAT